MSNLVIPKANIGRFQVWIGGDKQNQLFSTVWVKQCRLRGQPMHCLHLRRDIAYILHLPTSLQFQIWCTFYQLSSVLLNYVYATSTGDNVFLYLVKRDQTAQVWNFFWTQTLSSCRFVAPWALRMHSMFYLKVSIRSFFIVKSKAALMRHVFGLKVPLL